MPLLLVAATRCFTFAAAMPLYAATCRHDAMPYEMLFHDAAAAASRRCQLQRMRRRAMRLPRHPPTYAITCRYVTP